MSQSEDLARANRQMIAERNGLLAQLAAERLQKLTRAVHAFSEAVDGLEQMVAQANAGDPEARSLITRLQGALKRAEVLGAGLVLPGNGGGQPPG